MIRLTKVALLVFLVMLIAGPAFAQGPDSEQPAPEAPAAVPFLSFGALGAGIVMMAAAYGIGRIGSAAVESMARQPEVAGTIQIAMLIAAALIEGATFFALIICMQG